MKNRHTKNTIEDYPLGFLGSLKPSDPLEIEGLQPIRGGKIINGVKLSRQVIEELQRLGISLSWYHAGQLRDAVIACHHDGRLIDDPDGVHFRDMLSLTNREKIADEMQHYSHSRMRVKTAKRGPHGSTTFLGRGKDTKEKSLNGMTSFR